MFIHGGFAEIIDYWPAGEFCPSGLDVNLEFDPAKKCSAGKVSLRLCTVFPFCPEFAFSAMR
jgi:hypothetical protein